MINKLVLGTVQLGLNYGINNLLGKPSLERAFEILNTAFDNGIDTLDTAEAYGDSLKVIGAFQKKYPEKTFKIISKLSPNVNITNEELQAHINTSCKVLNVEQLYGYMFHNYSHFKQNSGLYDELLKIKKKKGLLNIGISLYTNDEIIDILTNFYGFDFIQIPFNLLDNHSKRADIILKAKDKGISIHTRSTFLQGLFFLNQDKLSDKMTPLKPYLNEIKKMESDYNLTTDKLALQYVLQKEYIDHVLIGVDSAEQLIGNISVCKKNISIPSKKIDLINVKETQLLNPSTWK